MIVLMERLYLCLYVEKFPKREKFSLLDCLKIFTNAAGTAFALDAHALQALLHLASACNER